MKVNAHFLGLFITLFFSTTLFAQKYTVTGTVVDEKGNPVDGAFLQITPGNYATVCEPNGKFEIELEENEYEVVITHINFQPISRRLKVNSDMTRTYRITSKAIQLEEVVITDVNERRNVESVSVGLVKLNAKDIENIPTFLGETDVIKSITLLPGVNTIGEGAAGFNVRGGRIDQNLVLYDGVQLFNSSHILGFFSIFNPELMKDFELYKGSVPAQYGGRASSVLSVTNKSGNQDGIDFTGSIGTISTKLTVDGPITDRLTFSTGVRFTYSDWILQQVNDLDIQNSSAGFYDFNARLDYLLNESNKVSVSYFRSLDEFQFAEDFGFDWSNEFLRVGWVSNLSNTITSQFSASISEYKSTLFDFELAKSSQVDNGVDKWQVNQNFLIELDKHEINTGIEIINNNSKTETQVPIGDSSIEPDIAPKDQGREYALYVDDVFKVSPKLTLSAGLRYTLYHNLGPAEVYQYEDQPVNSPIIDTIRYADQEVIKTYTGLSPRFSAKYNLGKNNSVKASFNRLYQFIHLISNTAAPTPVDIWQVSNTYIEPIVSNNYSFGFFQNFDNNNWELSFEVFYKELDNLVEYRDFADLLVNRNIETELLRAEGRNQGFEVFVKRRAKKWTGWLSYTYSTAEVRIIEDAINGEVTVNNGEWFRANYDQPHNFRLVSDLKLGKRGSLGTSLVFNSGRPITGIEGNYTLGALNTPNFSDRNKVRIPNYFRVDISVTAGSLFRKLDDKLVFSIYNLFGRRNAYSVFFQKPENQDLQRPFQLSVLGSAFPSISYTFKLGKP